MRARRSRHRNASATRPRAIWKGSMNRMKLKYAVHSALFLSLSFLAACGGSSSTKTTTTQTVAIAATSGTGQSAADGAAFTAPLVATVTTNGTPTAGVTVTFAAPSSGASGTFASGANTATTDASGKATSAVFSANTTVGGPYTVTATAPGATTSASFSLTNTVGAPVETITATSGSWTECGDQHRICCPLVATVMTGTNSEGGRSSDLHCSIVGRQRHIRRRSEYRDDRRQWQSHFGRIHREQHGGRTLYGRGFGLRRIAPRPTSASATYLERQPQSRQPADRRRPRQSPPRSRRLLRPRFSTAIRTR